MADPYHVQRSTLLPSGTQRKDCVESRRTGALVSVHGSMGTDRAAQRHSPMHRAPYAALYVHAHRCSPRTDAESASTVRFASISFSWRVTMAMDRDDVISVLNDLIATSEDGVKDFRACADAVKSNEAKTFFNNRVRLIEKGLTELQGE